MVEPWSQDSFPHHGQRIGHAAVRCPAWLIEPENSFGVDSRSISIQVLSECSCLYFLRSRGWSLTDANDTLDTAVQILLNKDKSEISGLVARKQLSGDNAAFVYRLHSEQIG